jgi:exodeoxyribonuclease VII large subunit
MAVMADDDLSNLAPVTVSELSGALKRTVEDRFGLVRVRGEVSGYRGPHSSGHCYFCLKDEGARLDAVIWKGVFARMRTRPEEGVEVVATGKLTTFPGKSSYQIVVESIELAGLGALMALLEKRRQAFAREGLFDEARKKPLPYLPQVIGVVTSPTGAVIRDILHRLADRFPRHVLVWPVRVQGETCADEVAAAIRGFGALPAGGKIPRPDVLIVARGGGSLEDLWGFNEEAAVRAAAECAIPLISAVGHETDWTLLDHVADRRAPTPTAAAEMAVPVRGELRLRAEGLGLRALEALSRAGAQTRRELTQLGRRLPAPGRLVEVPAQRLDRAGERVDYLQRDRLAGLERSLAQASALLGEHEPRKELAERRGRLATHVARLAAFSPARRARDDAQRLVRADAALAGAAGRAPEAAARTLATLAARLAAGFDAASRLGRAERRRRIETARERLGRALPAMAGARAARLERASALLESLSYKSALQRGFAVVRGLDATGAPSAPLPDLAALAGHRGVAIEFRDGMTRATVEDAVAGLVGPAPSPAPSPAAGGPTAPPPPAPPARAPRQTPKKPGRDDPSQGDLF